MHLGRSSCTNEHLCFRNSGLLHYKKRQFNKYPILICKKGLNYHANCNFIFDFGVKYDLDMFCEMFQPLVTGKNSKKHIQNTETVSEREWLVISPISSSFSFVHLHVGMHTHEKLHFNSHATKDHFIHPRLRAGLEPQCWFWMP